MVVRIYVNRNLYSSLAQANYVDLSKRLIDGQERGQDRATMQGKMLQQIQDEVKENKELLVIGNSVASSVREALRLDWLKQLSSDLKAFMQRIIAINVSTYKAVISLQSLLSSQNGGALIEQPFVLEDGIGRKAPVHLQFINSWGAFHAVLEQRFQDVQGYKKVQREEYILQEHATRREIKQSQRWETAFLPGQRIEMSFVFKSADQESTRTSCPSCKTSADDLENAEILW